MYPGWRLMIMLESVREKETHVVFSRVWLLHIPQGQELTKQLYWGQGNLIILDAQSIQTRLQKVNEKYTWQTFRKRAKYGKSEKSWLVVNNNCIAICHCRWKMKDAASFYFCWMEFPSTTWIGFNLVAVISSPGFHRATPLWPLMPNWSNLGDNLTNWGSVDY